MTADTELTKAMLVAACPRDPGSDPGIQALTRGQASTAAIRLYATALAGLAESFPRVVASMIAICDSHAVRMNMLANLLEEEGVMSFADGQLVVDPLQRHTSLGRRLALAAGAGAETLQPATPSRWFSDRIARGDWISAYAYSAVGVEANVPATFRLVFRALVDRYGFDPADLAFLELHITADERHGAEAAELISDAVTTDEERRRAVEGARRGGLAWWTLHRLLLAPAQSSR